jgi:Uma2 family endonuclease
MATVTLLSVEEYLQLPQRDDGPSDELIDGEIVLSPSAKPLHAKMVRRLIKLL